jgi:hypothetical protein
LWSSCCTTDRVLHQSHLVLGDALQHRDRIEQLLARALERRQRGLRTRHAILGGEILQLAPRLGDPRARILDVEIDRLELDDADLLLVGALVLGLLRDRVDLVGGEVRDHADLRHHAALAIREVSQLALLRERVGATGLLDREPRDARLVEHAALVADHGVESRVELALGLAQFVGERLHARAHDAEVGLGRRVVLAKPRGIGEPRRRLLRELERLREIAAVLLAIAGLGLLRVLRVGDAEVVGRAKPQLGIDAGGAARLDQQLLGLLELAARERADTFIVGVARGAILATARRQDENEDRRSHGLHPSNPRSFPDPTNSAASSRISEINTKN